MENDLMDLIQAVDIVEYIGQFTELTQKGREFWGLSPIKPERTPSFSVDPEKQSFYDFASGCSGGIVQFIEGYYRCSTFNAIKKLREYVESSGGSVNIIKKLSATNTCKKYSKENKQKKCKTVSNTCLSENVMDKYCWDKTKLLSWYNEGISFDVMKEFEVMYDPFTDRIVYPIRNLNGDIVNIGSRTLDPKYKEKGLRKYSYVKGWDGGMNVIYGLNHNIEYAKKSGNLILFEGAKSVLKAASWGIYNTGSILTSHLNPFQMRILISTCCMNNISVIFAFDKDVNILDDKNIAKLKTYLRVYYLYDTGNLLEEKDSPVDKGLEVFKTLCLNKKALR